VSETISSLIENLTIQQAIILAVAAIATSLVILAIPMLIWSGRRDGAKLHKIPVAIGALMLAGSLVGSTVLMLTVKEARAHGLYTTDTKVMPLREQIAKSPVDQSEEFARYLEENDSPKSVIVILYRLTCEDCEAVFEDLSHEMLTMPGTIFWVSSRSATGTELRDLYDIRRVPTVLYFDGEGRPSMATLATKDANGNVKLDQSVITLMRAKMLAASVETTDMTDATDTTKSGTDEDKTAEQVKEDEQS
jgi:hypothetical protein